MNKRTRVLNAMDSKPVDRVPVSFYTHFLSKEAEADNGVTAQVNWMKECGMDFLCVETDGYMEYPLKHNSGTIQDWSDLRNLKKTSSYFTGQLDRAKRIVDYLPDVCTFFMLFAPFTTIKHTTGGESKIMEYYASDQQLLWDAMKIIEEDTFILADRLMKETGITGFFVALQNAETNRFRKQDYEAYLRQWDINLLNHVNGLSSYNITHFCSWTGIPNNLDLWMDYPYQTVNWSVNIEPKMNLSQGRACFKKGTSVMGGFDNTPNGILYRGNQQEIKEFTKRQLDLGGQVGTLLSADCSVQMDQDPKRIRYVIEACEEYAQDNNG